MIKYEAISSNHYSEEMQMMDALNYIERKHPLYYREELVPSFPEVKDIVFEGGWLDYEAMNVDPEWSSWLIDEMELSGFVTWFDGEPFALVGGDNEED